MIAEADLKKSSPAAQNLVSMFEEQARKRGARTAVRYKQGAAWVDVSWSEMARRARRVADGLAARGLAPGDRVAIIGETNLEWILADLGILGAGGITVTIYQSNRPSECQYILADSGARFVFCDSAAQVAKIREVREQLPALEGIFRAQGPAADDLETTLDDLERAGDAYAQANPAAHEARLARVHRDDPASFIYTSGTTGNPKGVVLTHGNWVYEAEAVESLKIIDENDLILMFLPMAHSFAKVIEAVWFRTGATGAFVESLEKIVDNASEVRPTVMPSVPRIFEKAYNTVVSKGFATPGLKGKLFQLAMEGFDGYAAAREQGKPYSSLGLLIGRKLVFPKLAAALAERFGGRMRIFVSGGAPLSPKIAYFFDLLGFTILEGYGLTETSAGTFVNRPDKNRIGTVGPPVPGTEVRIAEDGEILVKGPCVMKEYFNNPAATAEVLKDGWLYTGDIGHLDEAGLPQDHRPQEGHHRHRGRQERRPAEPRERPQDRPARLAGDGPRRPAQVPLGPRHAERGERAEMGLRARSAGRRGPLPRSGADRADPAGDRRAQRPAAELRHHQAVRDPPARLHAGDRRAHPDPEGQAQGGDREAPGAARLVLRRVAHAPREGARALASTMLT